MPDYGTSLIGLFVSSFISATVLPGGSEVFLFAIAKTYPEKLLSTLAIATLGNTLGGMSTYLLGRLLPNKGQAIDPKRIATVKRYGSISLLFSWTPIIGDALCAAAGWLRLNWLTCLLWITIGKAARYIVVAIGAMA